MSVQVLQLEKVSLSDMQNFRSFVNILTAGDKYCLCNGNNFLKDLQMKLSQKQHNIFAIFLCLLEI